MSYFDFPNERGKCIAATIRRGFKRLQSESNPSGVMSRIEARTLLGFCAGFHLESLSDFVGCKVS